MSQSSRTSRLGLYIPFALAGLVIVLHAAYWFFVSGQIRAGAESWIEEQREAGYTIVHEGLGVGGYPFRFTVRLDQPGIEAPLQDGGWSVDLERLAGSAQFYNLNHWVLTPVGPAIVEVPDTSEPLRLRLETEAARLSIRSSGGATTRLGASLTALDIVSESGPRPSVQRIDQLDVSGLVTDEDVLFAALMGEGIVLAEGELDPEISGTFGETIDRVQLNASMSAFGALIQSGDPANWRQAGGAINIEPRPPASRSPKSPRCWPSVIVWMKFPTISPKRPPPASNRPSTTWSPRCRALPSKSSPGPATCSVPP